MNNIDCIDHSFSLLNSNTSVAHLRLFPPHIIPPRDAGFTVVVPTLPEIGSGNSRLCSCPAHLSKHPRLLFTRSQAPSSPRCPSHPPDTKCLLCSQRSCLYSEGHSASGGRGEGDELGAEDPGLRSRQELLLVAKGI